MTRVIFSVFLLYVAALMAGPASAGDGDSPRSLQLEVSPAGGQAGSSVTVTGSGADPNREVVITLSPQPHTADGALETVRLSTPDGTFAVSLTIPAETPDGRYYIRGEQFTKNGGVLQYYYNEFIVAAVSDALLPVTGTVPGTPFSVTTALALLLVIMMALRGIYAVKMGH